MKWFRLVSIVFLMLAMLLLASPVVYADDPPDDESNVVIDICVTGTTQVHVAARDGSRLDVGAQGTMNAHMHFVADADKVFDIYITGDGEADIDVSGPCEVNVKVEGPSQVYIDVDDEVKLDVEASDESQVFVDDEKVNSTGIPGTYGFNTSLLGDTKAVALAHTAQPEHNAIPEEESGTDKIMLTILGTGAFLIVTGLPCFWLIRRKARKEVK